MAGKPSYKELKQRPKAFETATIGNSWPEDGLWQSEDLFQCLFNDHTAVKLVIDPDTGSIIAANHAAAAFYGWTQETLTQMTIQQINILPPDHVEKAMTEARGQRQIQFQFRHRLADGSIKDVEVFSNPFMVKGKAYLHSIIHDITEQKRADQEQTIISEIGHIIGSSLNIDEVYERFAEEARKLIPFDRITTDLIDHATGTVRITYVSGLIADRHAGDTFPMAGTFHETLIRERAGMIIDAAALKALAEENRGAKGFDAVGIRSVLFIPLFSKGQVIGSLNFRSKTPAAYTQQDLALAQRIGDQIAGAIANAQSHAELKRAEEEMATIAEIGRIIGSSLNIDDIYERFAQEAKKLIDFDRLSVALTDIERGLVRLAHVSRNDIPLWQAGDVLPMAGSITGKICQTRKGLMVQGDSIEAITRDVPEFLSNYKAGLRSAIAVPLFSQGKVIGCLHFRSRRPNAYKPVDLRLAQRIGEQIAGAIANATLYGELRETEEALRESNTLFAHFMRHSPIYAFIKEVTPSRSTLLQASDNFHQWVGISDQEIIGKTMEELYPPALAKRITANDWNVVSAGKVITVEEEWNGRSYTTIQFPIANRDKTLLAGYSIDITERKQAYEAVQQSEAKFRAIMENSHEGILFMDGEARIRYLSPSFRQINGYEDKRWLDRRFFDLIHPDDLAAFRTVWEEIRKRPDSLQEVSYRIQHQDRTWKTIESTVQNLLNDPHIQAIFMTARDVTDRKRMEAQFLQAQKMEAVGRLAGGVAHDFNNMLGVILGHAELAMGQVDETHPLQSHLQDIYKAAERSAHLTEQLLAFARKQTIAPKVLDLNDTVAGMLRMLKRIIGEDIDLVWQPGEDLWPVKMDPSQLDQILANLCVNARDAISGVGKMTIETATATFDEEYCAIHPGFLPGDYVQLTVSDDGCGMDRETMSHLFEPFYTTKGMGKGTGLGLATVYGTIRQSNGFINVYSEPGQGTSFRIYFPRHIGKAKQEPWSGCHERPRGGHETVLLVEDEPDVLNLTATLLQRQGYTVLAAGTPGEAIRLAKECRSEIQLLMTDVVMPEMNGRELANHLLALYPNLRRLFTSGYTANVIAHHGVLDEGVHFIQKPFSLRDLAAKIRDVLDEP